MFCALFAKTVEITLPLEDVLEILGDMPLGIWIVLGILAYVSFGAIVVRWAIWRRWEFAWEWRGDNLPVTYDAAEIRRPDPIGRSVLALLWPLAVFVAALKLTWKFILALPRCPGARMVYSLWKLIAAADKDDRTAAEQVSRL